MLNLKLLAFITMAIVIVAGILAGLGIHGDNPEEEEFVAEDASEIAASFSANYSGFFGEDFYLANGYVPAVAKAYYPNGATSGYGSDSNYVTFKVMKDKDAAKEEFSTNATDYAAQFNKVVMGSKVIGTHERGGLDDAIGYYNNFNMGTPSSYLYYSGYHGNAFFESYIYLKGQSVNQDEVAKLAEAIADAILNPKPVTEAKIYVEPAPDYKGVAQIAESLEAFCLTFGDYVNDYSVPADATGPLARIADPDGKYYVEVTKAADPSEIYKSNVDAVKNKVGTTVMSTEVLPITAKGDFTDGTGNYYNSAKVSMIDYIGYKGHYYVHAHLRAVHVTDETAANMVEALSSEIAAWIQPMLEAYGNVNEDFAIDQNDVDLLRIIITNGVTADYMYADANFDGVVNSDDVAYLQKIIGATPANPVEVKHLNRFTKGDYYTVSKLPVDSVLMTGSSNMFLMAKYAGLNSEIKGIAYNGKIDASLFPEYQWLFEDASTTFDPNTNLKYRVGGSAGYFSIELSTKHIVDDKVKAIITADNAAQYLAGSSSSYANCFDEAGVKDNGLSVIRFKAASTDMDEYLSDLALLAFATGKEIDLEGMKAWCDVFFADIEGKLSNVDDKVRVAVTSAVSYSVGSDNTVSTYNYISSGTSDYTKVAVAAGGEFALADHDFKGSSSSAKMTDLGLWLKDYDVEKIVHIKTAATSGKVFSWYGGTALTDGKETLKIGPLALSSTEAYYNNEIYVVCGDMPVPLRIAYVAHVLYPELFTENWADSYNKSYSTKFLGMTESQIENGVFFVTMDDLGLKGGA